MKYLSTFASLILTTASLCFSGCSCSSDNDSYEEEYEDSDNNSSYSAEILRFNTTRDVLNYLNGKTFSGDGMRIRFYNNGNSVDVNGTNISNNVSVSDIGLNENNVAYATVRVANPAGITTTFALLAVKNNAQLIDPNAGSVYSY